MSISIELLIITFYFNTGGYIMIVKKNKVRKKSKEMRMGIRKKILIVVISMFIICSLITGGIVYSMITDLFVNEKLSSDLNHGYNLLNKEYQGNWDVREGKLYKGESLINDNFDIVDEIKKNTGTFVTIFLNDTRISTNVLKADGTRAVGTKAAPAVIETVLNKGLEYTGEANVVGMDCITKYVPIKDTSGKVIGMFFVGVDKAYVNNIVAPFISKIALIMLGIVIISVVLISLIVNRIVKNLNKVITSLESIAKGDLTIDEINVKSRDEVNILAESTNKMLSDLKNMLNKISSASMQVSASAEQLTASAGQNTSAAENVASSSIEAANGSRKQLESINKVYGIISDISLGINNVVTNSKDMFRQSQETVNITGKGSEMLNTLIDHMKDINMVVEEIAGTIRNLELRSQEISSIVELITDISEQTNLLALNASIEAARAGEHGRGFSVVAQEIRNLAEQTKESAAKISNTVHDIQINTDNAAKTMNKGTEKVIKGMSAADEVSSSFELIRNAIIHVLDKVKEVTVAADQMEKGSEGMVEEIRLIKNIAEENAINSQQSSAMSQEQLGATEEMAASSQNLSMLAEELENITTSFKL